MDRFLMLTKIAEYQEHSSDFLIHGMIPYLVPWKNNILSPGIPLYEPKPFVRSLSSSINFIIYSSHSENFFRGTNKMIQKILGSPETQSPIMEGFEILFWPLLDNGILNLGRKIK